MSRYDIEYLYHAIPLHYVPSLFVAGALYAKSVLQAQSPFGGALHDRDKPPVPAGITPRRTAVRRDRMLGLADYVHLAVAPRSPLVADKLRKGYAHALLVFDADKVLKMPEVALLPYNTKAWRTRACFDPVTDPAARASLLRRYRETGRVPSLEVLVKYGLPLSCVTKVAFIEERERVASLRAVHELTAGTPLFVTEPNLFPLVSAYAPVYWSEIEEHLDACRRIGSVPPPPAAIFD